MSSKPHCRSEANASDLQQSTGDMSPVNNKCDSDQANWSEIDLSDL